MIFRDLEKVRAMIKDATGLEVAYAFDDLVFPEHTAFVIQFDDQNANNFFCYFHKDCIVADQKKLLDNLTEACDQKKCTLLSKGSFNMKQKGEEVEIQFL